MTTIRSDSAAKIPPLIVRQSQAVWYVDIIIPNHFNLSKIFVFRDVMLRQELLNSCDSHLYPIVVTALNTGMRNGEILSLKWENVDLKHGFILLDMTKNGERREIPINSTLKETLRIVERRLDVPYVFYDKDSSKPYGDVKRSFNTACRKAGIKDFHFHDLRHTFASHLVMAGVDITTVKELLGHKTLTMTLGYSHLAPSHKVKAVDLLDKTIQPRSTIQKLYTEESF